MPALPCPPGSRDQDGMDASLLPGIHVDRLILVESPLRHTEWNVLLVCLGAWWWSTNVDVSMGGNRSKHQRDRASFCAFDSSAFCRHFELLSSVSARLFGIKVAVHRAITTLWQCCFVCVWSRCTVVKSLNCF